MKDHGHALRFTCAFAFAHVHFYEFMTDVILGGFAASEVGGFIPVNVRVFATIYVPVVFVRAVLWR